MMEIICKDHKYRLIIEEDTNTRTFASENAPNLIDGWGKRPKRCDIFTILRYNTDTETFEIMKERSVEKKTQNELNCNIEVK